MLKWGGLGLKSLKVTEIAPIDRAHTSSHYRSIVTMSLSCTISEI